MLLTRPATCACPSFLACSHAPQAANAKAHLQAHKQRGLAERGGKAVLPAELGGGRHRGFSRKCVWVGDKDMARNAA